MAAPSRSHAVLAGTACLVLLARGTRFPLFDHPTAPCRIHTHSFAPHTPPTPTMRRAAHICVLLLALGAVAGPRGARAEGPSGKDIENVMMSFIQDLTSSFMGPTTDVSSQRRLLGVHQVGLPSVGGGSVGGDFRCV